MLDDVVAQRRVVTDGDIGRADGGRTSGVTSPTLAITGATLADEGVLLDNLLLARNGQLREAELLAAPPSRRPTYLAADLRGLALPRAALALAPRTCGAFFAQLGLNPGCKL